MLHPACYPKEKYPSMKNTSANKTSPANTSSINTSSKEFEKESDQSRTSLTDLYASFGICREVLAFAEPVLDGLRRRFAAIDETAEYNQLRVIRAMQECHIGEAHLKGTTGYGYDDIGRDGLEKVYASYFGTEDALVRPPCFPLQASPTIPLKKSSGSVPPGDRLPNTVSATDRSTSFRTEALTLKVSGRFLQPIRTKGSAW